ncbi:MAG: acetyltransferase [Clostridia bacterium]|nr:acetyltransferase [Clostridia bacterium]
MIIKEYNKLNGDTISEIKRLVSACNDHDGLNGMMELDTSCNVNKEMKTVFMMYDDNKLVSALTLFVPGKKEGEVSAMTISEYRKKGCFTELVKRAEEELKKYGVNEILFLCEAKATHGKAAILKQKAQYEFTEYLLKYNHSLDMKVKEYEYRLKLKPATLADLESIIKISMAAFGDSYEGAKSLATGMLKAENRQFFLGEIEGEFVAMGVAAKGDEGTSIHGLGVLPEHQGKGYGKEMLYSMISKLVEQKAENINIEVESQNSNAFKLYKNSGFEVESAWEYYRKII